MAQPLCSRPARRAERRPRPGAERTVSDATIDAVIVDTLETTPGEDTHWSTREMARRHGIGKTTVAEIWRAFGLKPWQQDSFKVSPDPHLVEKVRDLVGLYMNPPVRHEAPTDRVG